MKSDNILPEDRILLKRLLKKECDYPVPENILDRLIDMGRMKTFDKWDNIISEGDINPDVYIAMEGILRCFYWDGDREKTAFFSTLPTLFMSYHSYFRDEPSFYTFQACTRARILHIKREDFDGLLTDSHEFAMWNLRLCQTQQYYLELKQKHNTGEAIDKYKSLVRELPNIMQEVPLQTVASYLGITPQYLSKLRKQMIGR
ncbi:MAG: Crp/Fnr family transcriptional regulator [Muribaculaceae bacterium]|nr:Crp/Fnr family transcriptional regulator [Muribaculaceae bacterium]